MSVVSFYPDDILSLLLNFVLFILVYPVKLISCFTKDIIHASITLLINSNTHYKINLIFST